ncbi:MAG: hypothetical protein M3362_19915, partial [Acidobacteriota bacterium]|nr:hypothetical protein [Acidobacteriota bacterium]
MKRALPLTEDKDGGYMRLFPALVSPDKRLLVRYDYDGVSLLDTTTGELVRSLGNIGEPLAFSPDGQMLLTVRRTPLVRWRSHEGLRLYDAVTGKLLLTFE